MKNGPSDSRSSVVDTRRGHHPLSGQMRVRGIESPNASAPGSGLQLAVCVCTRNRPVSLERCLRSVTRGDPRVAEVIVSDDSTDGETLALIGAKFPAVRYLEGPRRGLAANRNHAVRHVQAPFLLFLDDDMTLGSGFLDAIERCHATRSRSQTTIATGGVQEGSALVPPGEQRFLGFMDRVPTRDNGLTAVAFPATAFPRRLFEELRFDERLIYGYEDVDLAVRARKHGYEIIRCREAINDHERSPINRDMYRRHIEAARLYVTFKRYAFTEEHRAKALAFALVAPLHLIASRIKRAGLRGVWQSAQTLRVAVLNAARYRRGVDGAGGPRATGV
jgi:GT2 family glycosyltransferase